MHTNSLTFPTLLPGLSPQVKDRRPEVRKKRDFRLPELIAAMKSRLPTATDALSAEHLQRTAQQGRRIVLGTAEAPYEPLLLGGAPLRALHPFRDLNIVITTRSAEISEELELLAELDTRHAITIDFLVAPDDAGSREMRERTHAIARLTAEGLTIRLVAMGLPEVHNGTFPRRALVDLRRLFEAARKIMVFDVAVADKNQGWKPMLHRLRMEYGFPYQLPGRG